MITEDGNIKRYVHSDIVDEFNIGDCADISFPNGYGKGNRVCKQCAPTLNASNTGSSFIVKTEPNDDLSPTITTGEDSNTIVSEDNMKRQLCNHLIKEGLVKEGDVIRHSYTACRMEDSQPANTTSPGCCSTLDTRCDTLGVVVNDISDDVVSNKRLNSLVDKVELGEETTFLDCYNQKTSTETSTTITARIDDANHFVYNNYMH